MVTFQQIMFDSLVVLFFVMGIVAAAVGMGLVACSGKIFRLFQVLNRYVSTRQRLKPISVPRDIGPAVQRYRWWFAAAILAGSIYSLYSLTANFDTVRIAAAVVPRGGTDTFHVFMILLVEARSSFFLQLQSFVVFIGAGSIGLYASLSHLNPSGAFKIAALGLPFLTFYAITEFLLDGSLGVCVAIATAYGFTTLAMLIPAISEFDVALGRTTLDKG